jgi:hypothetical protein
VKEIITSPKFIIVTIAIIALIVVPLTLIEIQSQQSLRQNAESIMWLTTQSASTTCAADGSGANIAATFINTEPRSTSTDMNVIVHDQQTGMSANMGSIQGGDTKTVTIKTGRATLSAGSVIFALSWTDGHSGTDTRTASYNAVKYCVQPTPTPTNKPSPTPTTPPGQPTPTICPTLGPVKNVHIDCPNCKVSPSPSP